MTHYSPAHNPPQHRQTNSAPQTPVLSEYFVIPKHSVTHLPNGFHTQPQPFPAYSTTRLPIDDINAAQQRPLLYQPTAAATSGILLQPANPRSPSVFENSHLENKPKKGFCGLCCKAMTMGFTRSFETLAYGDEKDSDQSADHSFKVFAEETTMHGIKLAIERGKSVYYFLVGFLFELVRGRR